MFVALLILVLCAKSVFPDLAGTCGMVAFYRELGCTASPNATSTMNKCPEDYECPVLHQDTTKCYYKGVAYQHNETIPQDRIKNICLQKCTCFVRETATIECSVADCVESSEYKEDCLHTYEVDSCCATGRVCGKDAIGNLARCNVARPGGGGQDTYIEGQKFIPESTRTMCVCTKGWKNDTEDPNSCRDIECGFELKFQSFIANKCAPVFKDNSTTCPSHFYCQKPTSEVILMNVESTGKPQCLFGNLTLNIGDQLIATELTCTRCSCEVPPFVTCVPIIPCYPNS